jgi:exocyst complex protein 7
LECLGGDGYHLGKKKLRESSSLSAHFGISASKVVRTEKVGSGGYSELVKKQLRTGFPHLDAYGEARKRVAFKAIDAYYRKTKAARKKGSASYTDDEQINSAARDAVRCLEHAMVVVAGEKVSEFGGAPFP